LDLSIQFTGGSLVESDSLFHASRSNSIQHTKHTYAITISSIFGHIERYFDVTHGTQVVDFYRLDLANDGDEIGGIAQVTVMQKELDTSIMTILVDVLDTTSVETRGTTDNTMDLNEKESKVSRLPLDAFHPSIAGIGLQ
jgi:DNA integrity scanning protein DisA with diadenylate cyclase activity